MPKNILTCETCKPSTWSICEVCSTYYCAHHGRAVCSGCIEKPRRMLAEVVTVSGGKRSTVVWTTPYGSYRHQSSPAYYLRKDATEMLEAARSLGWKAHLRELPSFPTWRDWHGRRCGYSYPTFELWVELDPSVVAAEVGRDIRKWRVDRVCDKLAGMDRESYEYKETFARMSGLL